MANTNP
jgi:enolase